VQLLYAKEQSEGAGATLGAEASAEIVRRSASGAPGDQTVRLQSTFETAAAESTRALDAKRRIRQRKLEDVHRAVEEAVAKAVSGGAGLGATASSSSSSSTAGALPSTDIHALAGVHRLLLEYCAAYVSLDAAASGTKPATAVGIMEYVAAVQTEMAVALESVFPRASLRAFAEGTPVDRGAQMADAARLVLGIRLYNWDAGKGGVGMENTPQLALQAGSTLLRDVDRTASHAAELARRYEDVLQAVAAGALPGATAADAARWTAELANRRQAVTYASSLAEELRGHVGVLDACARAFADELALLKRTVAGSRAAPRDAVFPRFSALADAWLQAAETRLAVAASAEVAAAATALLSNTSVSTLSADHIRAARAAVQAGQAPPLAPFAAPAPAAPEQQAELASFPSGADVSLALQAYCPVCVATPVVVAEAGAGGVPSTAPSAGAALGLVRDGTTAAGVAKWRGRHYLCSSEACMASFVAAPDAVLLRVRAAALAHPELVHLLQLAQPQLASESAAAGGADVLGSFPDAALPALAHHRGNLADAAAAMAAAKAEAEAEVQAQVQAQAQAQADAAAAAAAAAPAAAPAPRVNKRGATVADAGVETPVHIVERHIDPRYEFSEWALRRRAVQIANLRKCSTHGAQTEGSSFRRDNDTQVYLPREFGVQTGITVATNTDKTVQFVTGVRGAPEPFVEAAAARVAAGKPALPSSTIARPEGPVNARVVQAVFSV
jgi:hypothetical protein